MSVAVYLKDLWEKRNDGYYFKGVLLHEYKADSLAILRQKFLDYSDEEKIKFKEEWAVIDYEFDKQRKSKEMSPRNIKTTIYKSGSYEEQENLREQIITLNDRMNELEEKLKVIIAELNRLEGLHTRVPALGVNK